MVRWDTLIPGLLVLWEELNKRGDVLKEDQTATSCETFIYLKLNQICGFLCQSGSKQTNHYQVLGKTKRYPSIIADKLKKVTGSSQHTGLLKPLRAQFYLHYSSFTLHVNFTVQYVHVILSVILASCFFSPQDVKGVPELLSGDALSSVVRQHIYHFTGQTQKWISALVGANIVNMVTGYS